MPRGDSRGLAGRLVDRAVGAVVPSIVDSVDVDDVIEQVDINELLERIDVDRLLDRIDPNLLLDRIDPNALLDRVDIDRLLDRVDVDRLVARVDVNGIVQRTEIDAIITRSTTGVFTQVLQLARVRLIAVDRVVHRLGRRPADDAREAGAVTRFLAFLVDQFLIGVLFAAAALLVASASEVVLGVDLDLSRGRWQVALAYALWSFVYVAGQLAATGRTVGKTLLGVVVVGVDGVELSGRRALVRTLVFPLSFVLFGTGFLVGLVRTDRRQLHDLVAGTTVLYAP